MIFILYYYIARLCKNQPQIMFHVKHFIIARMHLFHVKHLKHRQTAFLPPACVWIWGVKEKDMVWKILFGFVPTLDCFWDFYRVDVIVVCLLLVCSCVDTCISHNINCMIECIQKNANATFIHDLQMKKLR